MNLKTRLYEHQTKAYNKLKALKVGALYMEQGTGKTRTALELINYRFISGKIDHVLWLCPCSVKENLKSDIYKHMEKGSEQITICGIETLSSSIKRNIELMELVENHKVFLIVDESNLVKNPSAKRTNSIIYLAERCQYKLILNGTPISRTEADLFSQWYLLDWRILGYRSFYSFAANHLEYDDNGRIRRCLNVDYLTSKIAPYSYQVTKAECLKLPCKNYKTAYCQLTEEQYFHYMAIADELMFDVVDFSPETVYRLFTGLQNVISGKEVILNDTRMKTKPFFEDINKNPRLIKLMDIINQINDNEKVIIFCKYTSEINDIYDILSKKYGEKNSVVFYGKVGYNDRQDNIKSFENNTRFFIANKTCAGYGLNLQFCNYVVYYSNDWDYATRIQSEDRVHRIGQNNPVYIIDICAEDTLDEAIIRCLSRKEGLVETFKSELKENKDVFERFIKIPRRKS